MSDNKKTIVKMTGIMLVIVGLCMVPSMIVGVIYHERSSVNAFIITLVLCLLAGLILFRSTGRFQMKIRSREGYLVVAITWILISTIGAAPYVISGAIPYIPDAIFENCSGISTSGATILDDIEELPKSMLFWRAFTHWMGGMGIIVFFAAILPSIGISAQTIAAAEVPGPVLYKISSRFSETAWKLYKIYFGLTVAETVLLMLGGVNLFDALVHAFSTVATGGFSPYNASVGHFTSPYVHWVVIIFMLICGMNFNLFFHLKKGRIKEFFENTELVLYLGIVGSFSVLIIICLMAKGYYENVFQCITDSTFQVVSTITTTGFSTKDFDVWPTFCKMLIFILMFTGSCANSTSGGMKVIRILVCLKLIRRGISLRLHPNRYVPVRVDGKEIRQEVATNIVNFMFLYILVIFIGSVLVSFDGQDMITTVSAVVACIGNEGPGFNLIGPSLTFSLFSGYSKILLSCIMVAGRLELFTFVMLLSPHYWNPNKA